MSIQSVWGRHSNNLLNRGGRLNIIARLRVCRILCQQFMGIKICNSEQFLNALQYDTANLQQSDGNIKEMSFLFILSHCFAWEELAEMPNYCKP